MLTSDLFEGGKKRKRKKVKSKKKGYWGLSWPGYYSGYYGLVGGDGSSGDGGGDGGGGGESIEENFESLDSFTRNVLNRMQDSTWLSAERAYATQLGLKHKSEDRNGWEREVQRFIDLWNKHKGNQKVNELSYPGNIGAMEMVAFFKKASPEQKALMKNLLAQKDRDAIYKLIKEVTGVQLMTEDEQLFEIAFGRNSLLKWFKKDKNKGVRAGFEAELIFRDTQSDNEDEDEDEMEPDMDYDERVRSTDHIIGFFNSGDGYLSPREEDRINDFISETMMDYVDQFFDFTFSDFKDAMDWKFKEYKSDLEDKAREELGDDADEDEISDRVDELWDELLQEKYGNSWDDPDYEYYYDQYKDDAYQQVDFYDAMDANGLGGLSDWANRFNLTWPYYTDSGGDYSSNSGSRTWEDIKESLEKIIPPGHKVRISTGYHSAKRDDTTWILEPDGSLNPNDNSTEVGIELVSPPMPIPMAVEYLSKVLNWAKENDAYTNKSTGLHMGASLPTDNEDDKQDIDYLKLVMFLGDVYVLEQFGRRAAYYASSTFDKLANRANKDNPESAKRLFDDLREGMNKFAAEFMENYNTGEKYQSVHNMKKYVEFRSIGGDYLKSGADEGDFKKSVENLESIMLRYGRAMQIAGNPEEEKKNYGKKLYKFLVDLNKQFVTKDPRHEKMMEIFAQYSSGAVSPEEFKLQWSRLITGDERSDVKNPYVVYALDKESGTWMDMAHAVSQESAYEAVKTYLKIWPKTTEQDYKVIDKRKEQAPDAKSTIADKKRELANRIDRERLQNTGILIHAPSDNLPGQMAIHFIPTKNAESIPNLIAYIKQTDPNFKDIPVNDIQLQKYTREQFLDFKKSLGQEVTEVAAVAESKYHVKYTLNNLPKKATIIAESKSKVRQIFAENFGTKSAYIKSIGKVS